ncbi:MAG: carbohydrate ABC transporter substrate-binding protein [Ruminococcaceae bacterium]|nr:carbohydrate ABC transporter substrate-binding protein [Oscillospiraceae bacterium]
MMKIKSAAFRILSLVLCLLICLGTFSCTGGELSEKAIAEKKEAKLVTLENVYKTTYIEMPEKDENGYLSINTVHTVGDDIYFDAYFSRTVNEKEGIYENGRKLFKVDTEAKKTELVRTFYNPREVLDRNATSNTYENIGVMALSSDGNIWYINEKGFSDWSDPENYIYESNMHLICENMNSERLFEINLNEVLSELEHFYVSAIFFDDNGAVVFADTAMVFVSNDGAVTDVVDFSESGEYFNNVKMFSNGDIVGLTIDWNSENTQRKLKKYDKASKTFVDMAEIEANFYTYIYGEGDLLYYNDTIGVHSYNIVTKESKEVLNFINSDLNANRVNIIAAACGGFVAQEYTKDWSDVRIALLEKVSDTDTVKKYVIDFASIYLNDNIRDVIIDFNKQNTEYRINYIDYSKYIQNGNYSDGVNRLNQDIIKGNIPDIFSVEGLPLENYTSKKLIADLSVYMDNDPEFKKEDYLENILNITADNGKIYSVIPSFSVNTFITQEKYTEGKEKLTVDDLLELTKRYPESFILPYYTTRTDLLTGYMGKSIVSAYSEAVDKGTGSFADGNFAKYLEFVKSFPETFDWNKFYEENPNYNDMNMYLDGSCLMQYTNISVFDMSYAVRQHGPEYTYIGFPVPGSESLGYSIIPECEIAVSAKSVMKDEAWEFVKYLYSDEFQKSTYTFPVKKSILEEKANEVLKRYEEREEQSALKPRGLETETATEIAVEDVIVNNAFIGVDDVVIGYEDQKITFTQKDIDKILKIITSADIVAREDKEISMIIEEEAGGYFSDKKSANDVCSVIDGRVQQYIFENR